MLRDYQADICSRVNEALELHRSVMVQMPTGTGKTVVLAELVRRLVNEDEDNPSSFIFHHPINILIVAHRRELIEQIKATIKRVGLNAKNHSSSILNQTIVVESIQTVSRRIDSLCFTPSLIVIDEAHHALAKTYKMMWEAWPEARFIGLTATPCRLNGKGFTDLFDCLVQSWDIPTFIKERWLSTYDFVSIKAGSDTQRLIRSLKKRGADGDYQVKEMDAVLNKRPSIERLYQSFMEYAQNRKGFVYAINIDHARSIAEYYRSKGIAAVDISAQTPAKERERLISLFKNTAPSSPNAHLSTLCSIQVLVNVDIFSEGFDCPDMEFIQLARPTLSLAKYLQMVGRGLRPSKGKKNCMIIDNVGLYRVFGLPSQIWNWKGMFKGLYPIKDGRLLSIKGEGLRMKDNLSSLIINQSIGSVMYMVVSHEQLDATFEQQKRDDALAREREKLLNGGYGKVCIVGKQLAEVRDTRGKLPSYVDLYNMNWFYHAEEGKPALVRLGDVDFLRYGSTIISRTRIPIKLSYYKECIERYSFYTVHDGPDKENMDCIHFYRSRHRYGVKAVVFLHDEPLEYYWKSCRLEDGGLVIISTDGCYYHAQKGQPKVYLGCADTEENRNLLIRTVLTLIKEAEQRYQEKQNKFRHDVESLEYVEPYQVGMKWGLRGSDGRVLAPPVYRTMKEQNGYFLFEEIPLHRGVMDKFGKILIEPKHDKVEITPDGKAITTSITGNQTIVDLS